jgi:hypothetical protein
MPCKTRLIALGVLLFGLASSTLQALPLMPQPRPVPTENGRGDFLTTVVDWIASIFTPDLPFGDTPEPQTKEGSHLDPHGGDGGGG